MQPKISLGLATTPFKAQTVVFSSEEKLGSTTARVFFLTWAHYDIISTVLHLSRTTSHLTNVGRKVCQWSRGQSARDLWKYMICGVLPLNHLQATYGKQPTYITKCGIMDIHSVCPTINTELFLRKLINGDPTGSFAVTAEGVKCQ